MSSETTSTGNEVTFLSGGGELGERMREKDWSKTSLGPAALWPQSLKTAVRITLTSRQPMFVWWGEELINLYNDPYQSILGGKHPDALGLPASVVWREIWDQVGPRAASAIRNNEGTYDEALLLIMERHGYPEETHYTFSYSPVPNDQGGNGGILCANTDDTQRILGERQLALLRDLAAQTADARTFDQACTRSAACLLGNPYDLPFSMIYLLEPSGRAVLAGTSAIEPGHLAAPRTVEPDSVDAWPFAQVLRSRMPLVVSDLSRFGPLPMGAWNRTPHKAVVVPISPSGKAGKAGVLVAGLNPYRLYDDSYRGFIELIAAQIAASFGNAQAYEEERKRAEALAELDRAKTAFFSNVSHEFRTPLALMLGPLEDVIAKPELGREDRELLSVVHRNGLRLLKLVNTLLDFSRIEAGRVQAVFEPVELSGLTSELASVFRAAIERAGLRLVVDCPPLSAPVFVDRDMWEKIVLNLVSNAFKYTLEGEIRVSLRELDGAAVLSVRDTGTGIPEEELPKLFNRFYRVEGARGRTQEGSGIGLALVLELAKLHGGKVQVESKSGEGSVFTVAIPLGRDHLPADRIGGTRTLVPTALGANPFVQEALRWLPDARADHREGPYGGLGDAPTITEPKRADELRAKVVVVDDNADLRAYLARLLSRDYEVVTASDGLEGLRAAREQRPDAVVTDVMMPSLDGFGLLKALRSEPETASIPVIMLSARAGEEARVEGLEAGADDYLTKPFSARELLARLSGTLALSKLRREATRREEELKAETRAVLESIDQGFVTLDAEFRIAYVNEGAERIYGSARAELVGRVLWDLCPPFLGTAFEIELRRAMSERVPVRFESFYEPWSRWFEVDCYPAKDGGLAIYSRDISEQKLAIEALREADRRKDEFLGMLSHELRNPLTPISNSLYVLQRASPEGEQARRARAVIERQVSHLTRLVDDLLDVTRITRGKIRLQRTRFDLGEVVRRTVEDHRSFLAGHEMSLEVPSEPVWIDGDATRMVQVIGNLVHNASKFTPQGGTIALLLVKRGRSALLEVRDDGIGMDTPTLRGLFEPFMQADRSIDRSRGGLGLGLALVKGLVTLHGGTVKAHSDGPGRGSCFTIEMPLDEQEVQSEEPLDAPSASTKGRKVLVIEDNRDAAISLSDALQCSGHRVVIASNGEAGLARAREFLPDVVLCDVGLPAGMDGYAVARALRREPVSAGAYLIALTGYAQPDDQRRAFDAGFDAHMAKPPDLAVLDRLLSQVQGGGTAGRDGKGAEGKGVSVSAN